jgi:hypothetical protein
MYSLAFRYQMAADMSINVWVLVLVYSPVGG